MNLAQTLIADPTFNLMSRAERLEEARAIGLVAGMDDDDLAFALAVEEAEGLLASGFSPAEAVQAPVAGIEPCREDRASCASPVAGNGRCMECGARRAAETPADPHATPVERLTIEAIQQPPRQVGKPAALAAPVLARFKAVTGHNDRDIGDLLNLARSTVQGYVAGRMAEKLTPSQLRTLYSAARDQADKLNDLATQMEDSIST